MLRKLFIASLSGGQDRIHRGMSTGSPRPLAGVSKHNGVLVAKPQLFEVLHLGAREVTTRLRLLAVFQTAGLRFAPAPLLPQKCAQSPHDPAIELFEELLA